MGHGTERTVNGVLRSVQGRKFGTEHFQSWPDSGLKCTVHSQGPHVGWQRLVQCSFDGLQTYGSDDAIKCSQRNPNQSIHSRVLYIRQSSSVFLNQQSLAFRHSKWGMYGLADARPLFVSRFSFYYSSFTQASVRSRRGSMYSVLHLGWDFCLSSSFTIPSQSPLLDGWKNQRQQSLDGPALWRRETLAIDNLCTLRPKEVRELFLGGEPVLFEPVDAGRISSAAHEAW